MLSSPRSRPATRSGITLMLVGLSLLTAACSGGDTAVTAELPTSEPMAVVAGGAPAAEASEQAHAAEGEGATLLAIMQDLGTYMASLTHGLLTDDATLVETSAESIAEHAPVAPSEIERIQGILGNEMEEFGRLDAEVHTGSVQLHEAAAAGRTDDVLTRLNEVQRGCVACHTAFRERLRTNPAQ